MRRVGWRHLEAHFLSTCWWGKTCAPYQPQRLMASSHSSQGQQVSDLYAILGVKEGASLAEIKRAYR